jgi:hypothetical protein
MDVERSSNKRSNKLTEIDDNQSAANCAKPALGEMAFKICLPLLHRHQSPVAAISDPPPGSSV